MDDEFALELDDDPLPTGLCAITNHAAPKHGASAVSVPSALCAAALSSHTALKTRHAGQSPPAKQPRLADCTVGDSSAAAASVASVSAEVVDLDMTAPANAAGLGALQRAAARARPAGRSPATGAFQMQQRAPAATRDAVSVAQRGTQQRHQLPSVDSAQTTQPRERMQEPRGRVPPDRHETEDRLPGVSRRSARAGPGGASPMEQPQPDRQHEQQEKQQQVDSSRPRRDQPAGIRHSQPARADGVGQPHAARLPSGAPLLPAPRTEAPRPKPSERGGFATGAPAAQQLLRPQLQRHRPRADGASANVRVTARPASLHDCMRDIIIGC